MKGKGTGRVIGIIIMSVFTSLIADVGFVKDNHFNLITVNSVLIGFLFTTFSILLGFLDEKIIQIFEEAGALKKVYSNLILGIKYSLVSIVISMLNMTLFEKYISNKVLINIIYSLELMFLISALLILFLVIKYLKIIIDSINFNKRKVKEENKADKELEAIINKEKNKR